MPLAETVAPTSCASDGESVAMAATNGPSSLLNRTNFQRGSISSVMMSETMVGHYSARYDDEKVLLDEAKQIFPNTILSREGMTIEL